MVRSLILAVAAFVAGGVAFKFLNEGPTAYVVAGPAAPQDPWFQREVVDSKLPVIVDFTATWCGPCKLMKKDLDQLEQEMHGKLKIVPVDADEHAKIVEHYNVSGFPTLLLMKQGKIVAKQSGTSGSSADSYMELKQFVSRHL